MGKKIKFNVIDQGIIETENELLTDICSNMFTNIDNVIDDIFEKYTSINQNKELLDKISELKNYINKTSLGCKNIQLGSNDVLVKISSDKNKIYKEIKGVELYNK